MSAALQEARPKGLMTTFANKYGVDPTRMNQTLKATAFRQANGQEITNEQMMALVVVAHEHGLNPFTKEIYAFPDRNQGVVPIVGVDGWARIINNHPQFDGMHFDAPASDSGVPEWMECTIYRKDRNHPTAVREYFAEVRRDTAPWKSHPRRMLRHKAMIQCARLAFSFTGIYDQDEGERIIEGQFVEEQPAEAKRPALEPYTDDQFAQRLPGWSEAIESGRMTAQDVINKASTRGILSEEQQHTIRECGDAKQEAE